MTASALVLVPLGLYMLVLIGLGLWGRREGGTLEGYYVAGKKLPSWVIAFSSNATGESGWLLLGLTGMGYAVGFHALWVVFGEVMGVAIAWTLVSRPFKEYTDRYRAITVPDYLEERFRDRRQLLRKLSIAIVLSMVAVYCCAQLVATGKAFSSFLGFSYEHGVLLGAGVTIVYTAVGGFKAVAYSDLVQGLLMVGGLVMLPIAGIAAAGGWNEVVGALQAADPDLLRAMGSHGATWAGVLSAASFAGIGLAFLGVPQLLTRFMSAASGRELVRGGRVAVVCMVLFDLGAVFTGIAGRALFPLLDDPETVMPSMSAELFPGALHRHLPGHRAGRDHVDRRFAADPRLVGRRQGLRAEDPRRGPRRRPPVPLRPHRYRRGGRRGDPLRPERAAAAVLVHAVCLVRPGRRLRAGRPLLPLLEADDASGRPWPGWRRGSR